MTRKGKKYFKKFAEKIRTKEELIFYLEQIVKAKQLTFKAKNTFLSEKVKRKVSEDLREFLEEREREEIISRDAEKQFSFLEKLENYILSFKPIKLEIAFLPDERTVREVSQWIEEKVGRKVILDITVNPKIVGGAIIEYKGNWRDFSLAKKIDNLTLRKENGGRRI